MAIKDILVHMDSAQGCSTQVETAISLAAHHDAHLTGLYTDRNFVPPSYAEIPLPQTVINEMEAGQERNRERIEAHYLKLLSDTDVRGEWRYAEGDPISLMNRHARYADLVVCGQTQTSAASLSEGPVGDHVAMQCGRPVLVVPESSNCNQRIGQRVYVAWNGSREATRAINDALPLLQEADEVKVVAINVGNSRIHGDLPGADMALHLARHGVNACAERMDSEQLSVGELLVTSAEDNDVDLIVMGAYGHSRFREFVFGGVTRHVLANLTTPVLLSH